MATAEEKSAIARLKRLAALNEKLIELQAKQAEVTEEMTRLISGEAATGDMLRALEATYSQHWETHYGSPYVFAFTKDRPQWKRLMKATSFADVLARIPSYFKQRDDFLATRRHPFIGFVSRFNNLAPATEAPGELTLTPPVDCHHTPPCKSDQEHTRRKLDELRPSR